MDIEDAERQFRGRCAIGRANPYRTPQSGYRLFQVFVYDIDTNACREETKGTHVAMVGIE